MKCVYIRICLYTLTYISSYSILDNHLIYYYLNDTYYLLMFVEYYLKTIYHVFQTYSDNRLRLEHCYV